MTIAIHAKDKAFKTFDEHRAALGAQGAEHELAARKPFEGLLEAMGKLAKWTLVVEQSFALGGGKYVRPDGTLYDDNRWPRGYWEAKDAADDLDLEIDRKIARGYPVNNMIFADTRRAVLFQNKIRVGEFSLEDHDDLARLFTLFLNHEEPEIAEFEKAVERFKEDTPKLAESLKQILDEAHRGNKRFQSAYDAFYELAARSLNPNISRDAVDEMLIQHLLTERLMRTVFQMGDFRERNPIAAEVEKVIRALTSASFSRDEFLARLDYFYSAIENAARDLPDWREKQAFINTIYERFFQGYAVKVADTHGIVYTPQPIVDFMSAAVEEVLLNEFGQRLWDQDVCIIDPATGTGNFIINLMRRIARENPAHLPDAYANRLFANEVMLLPYYIASLNIEHEYRELTGSYAPFEGLCFVDTLGLAEGPQMQLAFMSEENTERVQRQKAAPITVIIGNPPYNVGQLNENDNNKNRKYEVIDKRTKDTYVKDSTATLRMQLYDPYVKFFRWATDRLGDRDGIVCFVTNNGFFDGIAFDGMRKHLFEQFSSIYHLDLSGNARTSGERRRKEGGNVFDDAIRVGVGITIAVRFAKQSEKHLYYYRVPDYGRKEDKLGYLAEMVREDGPQNALNTVDWVELTPDAKHTWNAPENVQQFSEYVSLGTKESKRDVSHQTTDLASVFKIYSNGVKTNADSYLYDFDRDQLISRARLMVQDYRTQLGRWLVEGMPKALDGFLIINEHTHKWIRHTKKVLLRGEKIDFNPERIRIGLYRPFQKAFYYSEPVFNEDVYQIPKMLPTVTSEAENLLLCVSGVGQNKPFQTFVTDHVPGHDTLEKTQAFPFYVYDEDGSNRRENITDWALAQFQSHYNDPSITKWDIFYYVYAMLHHPVYRSRYAANLKRELPRIPFAAFSSASPLPEGEGPGVRAVGDAFHHLARIGKSLADRHVGYEHATPFPLQEVWKPGKGLDTRVTKMRLSKDRTAIEYNAALTLTGIPAQAFEYRLGSRSALDWIIDQYQVKTDARTGITSDPNAYSDDPRYIIELIKRVVRVSVDTVAQVKQLESITW